MSADKLLEWEREAQAVTDQLYRYGERERQQARRVLRLIAAVRKYREQHKPERYNNAQHVMCPACNEDLDSEESLCPMAATVEALLSDESGEGER